MKILDLIKHTNFAVLALLLVASGLRIFNSIIN